VPKTPLAGLNSMQNTASPVLLLYPEMFITVPQFWTGSCGIPSCGGKDWLEI